MKGVYAAFFRLEDDKTIKIGSLGAIDFRAGIYVYVGSAMNSVEKRVERHFSETENKHWHIDYFSENAAPIDYFALPLESESECELADLFSSKGDPVGKFGSSDCSCNSHMFYLEL